MLASPGIVPRAHLTCCVVKLMWQSKKELCNGPAQGQLGGGGKKGALPPHDPCHYGPGTTGSALHLFPGSDLQVLKGQSGQSQGTD